MFNIVKRLSTHSGKMERWLGKEQVEHMSSQVRHWYGPPIAVGGVPGLVYARGGGDFVGPIRAGKFASMADQQFERMRRLTKEMSMEARLVQGTGFSSLSDMISKWTQSNKGQSLWITKTGVSSGTSGRLSSSWYSAGTPGAGAVGAAAPGGTVHAKGDAGSYPVINTVTGSESLNIVSAFAYNPPTNGTMLLYDRLFSVAKTMSSTASEAVTGVPTRYTSTTSTDWNYAGGNFMFPETTTTLSGTAHNWDSMQYTDQNGNTAQTCPVQAGVSSSAVAVADLSQTTWFMPLDAGDIGLTALTSMKCSASVTGGITWVVGHPLVMMPIYSSTVVTPSDYTNSAFGITRMYDTACLALGWFALGGGNFQPTVNINILAG